VMRYYKNIPISHDREDWLFLQTITRMFQPQLIVELGTMQGGLTTALHDAAPHAQIATFDKDPSRPHPLFVELLVATDKIYYKRTDLLGKGANGEVLKYLEKPVKKMLYCDNGNKLEELLLYAPYLQQGDVVGAHDWGTEIHTRRRQVKLKFRQHGLLYKLLRRELSKFFLIGQSRMCRLWMRQ